MKRMTVVLLLAASLGACDSKERLGLKEALVEKLQDDSDLKDYKLEPAKIADCVVSEISKGLPGFPGDPRRDVYFDAYARFVAVQSPSEADAAVNKYQSAFGSVPAARQAAMSVTEHIMSCMGQFFEDKEAS
jgi:hypothetical protein